MFRSLIFLGIWFLVFTFGANAGWAPVTDDFVTTGMIGTVIQGLYHGYTIPWNAGAVFLSGELPESMTYVNACLFEPAYEGNVAYTLSWAAGIIGAIGTFLDFFRG